MLTHDALNEEIQDDEDEHFLQESVKRFGAPRSLNYENSSFPGPEISTNKNPVQENVFIYHESGSYTLK